MILIIFTKPLWILEHFIEWKSEHAIYQKKEK